MQHSSRIVFLYSSLMGSHVESNEHFSRLRTIYGSLAIINYKSDTLDKHFLAKVGKVIKIRIVPTFYMAAPINARWLSLSDSKALLYFLVIPMQKVSPFGFKKFREFSRQFVNCPTKLEHKSKMELAVVANLFTIQVTYEQFIESTSDLDIRNQHH